MNKTWRCPLLWNFFGLDHNYQKIIYEQVFALKYHGNWSFIEVYNLPIGLRNWFIKRLQEQLNFEKEQLEASSKGSNDRKSFTLS